MPPDTFQSIALVDVVKSANWSYVSTVYSEGSYGEYGIEVFTREATERNVCIAAALKVPSAADDKVFDDIIQRLSKKPNARAIVLFTRAEDARGILEAARRSNLSQSFQVGRRERASVLRNPSSPLHPLPPDVCTLHTSFPQCSDDRWNCWRKKK